MRLPGAADLMSKAATTYQRMGKLNMAAKQVQAVAEMYETTLSDNEAALAQYTQAAELYEMEDSSSSANKCHIKARSRCALSIPSFFLFLFLFFGGGGGWFGIA